MTTPYAKPWYSGLAYPEETPMPQPFQSTTTGLDSASAIPAGASLVGTAWHIARFYGPSAEAYPTEADALAAALDEREAEVLREDRPLTIDLRWKMQWEQGTPDANGRPTASCGIEFTAARRTYASAADAAQHLANIRAVYGADRVHTPVWPTVSHGDTVTTAATDTLTFD
jgi:hypothetical protein